MTKVAWIFTHDQYIDRRIFFFADVLKSKGYQIKLFPDHYYDVLAADDYNYIVRPEEQNVVREYNVSKDSISKDDKEIFDYVIRYENNYYAQNKKYSTARVKQKTAYPKMRIDFAENDFSSVIKKEKGLLYYNNKNASFGMLYDSKNEYFILQCEEILLKILSNQPYKELAKEKNIQILKRIMGKGESFVYFHPINSNLLYKYDFKKRIIIEYSAIKKVLPPKDNFEDFRTYIYDYSKIEYQSNKSLQYEHPDLVYVADLPTLPIGIKLKEKFGCKIIMDCHEWWFKQTELWEASDSLKCHLVDLFEMKLYPRCDLRITVGEYLAQRMSETLNCSFEVIYSCMDNELEQNNKAVNLKEKYNLPQNAKIAIFQGGMSTFRNLENLARATKFLSEDSYLLLLTTGDYQAVFKKILINEGNPERVIWGGWIPQKELLGYTRGADLGIIPYTAVNDYSECFVPNKLMEYFTATTPIFYDSSLKELLLVAGGNEVGYGTNLKDPINFGQKLNDLLHNSRELQRLKMNYDKCKGKFGYENQKNKFEELLYKYNILEES